MNAGPDPAIAHYATAMQAIDSLWTMLLQRNDAPALALLETTREHIEQGFWLAHLRVLSNVREIAATPYCRRIPLTPSQGRNLDLLRRGMHEAQCSLAPDGLSAPWNALFLARQRFSVGMARKCFETGYLIRFFQLLQEARHGVSHWSLGNRYITPLAHPPRPPA
ncbi:hypothetical protein LNN38_05180 [Pseudomonas sp. LA21]|uniref:hypothetical protein n=1 Tax=unclassified Pseudomonas TaxID=196821 RepID=UPI001FB6A877|nr:hypothetical protein [Pseudomonas sp. LA21]MCJ1884236.1 hypothetical protein [Pseudomonas sp. LA21]